MKKGVDFIGVGCGAFIFNDNGQLLLTRRSSRCRNKAGFWSVPGGGVERFEVIEDALTREIKEEIGVDIEVLDILTVSSDIIVEEDQHWVSPQFLCKIVSGVPKNLEPDKCEEICWFGLDSLPKDLTNNTIDGLKKLKIYRN